jgi:DNA-binding response OmpR family regulator
MDHIVHRVLRFDRFALDLARGCLRAGDQEIALRPKTFEVLCHLAENPGPPVSKQGLFEAVWPNVSVCDDSLVQCHSRAAPEARRHYQKGLFAGSITHLAAFSIRYLPAFRGTRQV